MQTPEPQVSATWEPFDHPIQLELMRALLALDPKVMEKFNTDLQFAGALHLIAKANGKVIGLMAGIIPEEG